MPTAWAAGCNNVHRQPENIKGSLKTIHPMKLNRPFHTLTLAEYRHIIPNTPDTPTSTRSRSIVPS
ncbi:hypothetical protein [Kingella sp. (in: b-proteobacteria)]|uniref:hypothetical protein n=1 Tax=Kingella sp. (in: b-proteobacteria) TaxID=2020713 RepID=UPI0026DC6DAC|nr:hypothetical protein [Kingella sp. (in: b-proteobacteria)]MDO4658015.1 hypothetical protein [Kingella sp. (in: b-proteobacteria)]